MGVEPAHMQVESSRMRVKSMRSMIRLQCVVKISLMIVQITNRVPKSYPGCQNHTQSASITRMM
jgi:hypothetical protein